MLGLHALLQVGQRAGGGLLLGLLLAGSFAFAYELAVQPAFDAVEAAVVGAGGAGVAVLGKGAAAGLGDLLQAGLGVGLEQLGAPLAGLEHGLEHEVDDLRRRRQA